MEINYQNLNDYLKKHPSDNSCGHSVTSIDKEAFEKIGKLYDESFGTLSYLSIQSKNKQLEYTGAYPLIDCEVLKCKTCDQVVFFHLNHGWIAPRPEYFLADYKKDYLCEPAVKRVFMPKSQLQAFISVFGLIELNHPERINEELYQATIDPKKKYIFNYKEHKEKEKAITVHFDVVAYRKSLRDIHRWLTNIDE